MLVAINKFCVNKPNDKALFGKINRSFENVDIPLRELADNVKKGFAFSAQHSRSNRTSDNFLASSVLAVDVDTGLRLETALADDFIQQFGGFVYTTVSHTAEDHHFRVVFDLEQPITDRDQMKHALTGLIARLGGDRACTDACRMFFGNTAADITFLGKQLPASEVQKLATRGPEVEWSRRDSDTASTGAVTVHSRVTLSNDVLVRDSAGATHRLVDLPKLTPIHCPMHVDNHPSAFTISSRKGTPGVHCKACGATYYVTAEGPYYDFDYDLRVLRNKSLEEWEVESSEDALFEFDEVRTPTGVHFISEEFLSPIETNASVVLIRSPKGTGKTEWLRKIVERGKANKQSILLIGHRQSLIMATAERLGLSPYIMIKAESDNESSKVHPVAPTNHYAICLDSMPTRLDTRQNRYDIVIIDEIEQVLSHLTSTTLRDNRQQVVLNLGFYLRSASKVYALDADLNRVTVMALPALMGDGSKSSLLVVNDWAPKRGPTYLYRAENQLIDVLRTALDDGKRCFVCSNSKSLIEKLALSLQERYGDAKAFRWITSDNSQLADTQTFLKGLPDSLLAYDALLVSPAVGTGVDITFKGSEQKVDAVFGLFKSRITTHFDIDQQLCRVRHPGEVHVWVSPEKFSFETSPAALRGELENATRGERQVVEIADDGTPKYSHADTVYAEVFAEVKALQRASKNNLRENFCELRKQNGWEIVEVERSAERVLAGRAVIELGEDRLREDQTRKICGARELLEHEYLDLRDRSERGTLLESDVFAMRRYEIESFYRRAVSQELLELDDDGQYRRAVRLYESINESGDTDIVWQKRNYLRADVYEATQHRQLLRDLLTSAGVFSEASGFDRRATITHDDLAAFVELCQQKRVQIERLLDVSLRSDYRRKPAQQLGVFLKLVGLKLEKVGTHKRGTEKVYTYRIDQTKLAAVESIVGHRADAAVRAEWDRAKSRDSGDEEFVEAIAKLRDRKAVVTPPDGAGRT